MDSNVGAEDKLRLIMLYVLYKNGKGVSDFPMFILFLQVLRKKISTDS